MYVYACLAGSHKEQVPKQPSARTPIRIVIISEHAIHREALRSLLEAERDFTVAGAAADCAEGADSADECTPDVVLVDVNASVLPDGDALTKFVRLCAAARVIVIVPAISPSVISTLLRCGVRGIVPKASPSELLFRSIRTVLSGQYWIERDMVSGLVEAICAPPQASPATHGQSFHLTGREREIVSLLVGGYANKEIADKCAISQRTVKHHLANVFAKFGCSSRLEVVLFALHHRLVPINRSSDRSSLSA